MTFPPLRVYDIFSLRHFPPTTVSPYDISLPMTFPSLWYFPRCDISPLQHLPSLIRHCFLLTTFTPYEFSLYDVPPPRLSSSFTFPSSLDYYSFVLLPPHNFPSSDFPPRNYPPLEISPHRTFPPLSFSPLEFHPHPPSPWTLPPLDFSSLGLLPLWTFLSLDFSSSSPDQKISPQDFPPYEIPLFSDFFLPEFFPSDFYPLGLFPPRTIFANEFYP